MKFIDEASIVVQSGDGGGGCVSFRREKFIPKGGPDGGDGGHGGDVIFQAVNRKRTLFHFRNRRHFKATNGAPGKGRLKTGKSGDSLIIEIPPGTLVYDAESGTLIKDFTCADESLVIAKGGRGGQGNTRFKSSTRRTPRFAQPGEEGQTFQLKLELKLLADVGIIGLPNAGKSTLISVISSARPKIANYPFTTLTPTLGIVKGEWGEAFAVADIPGLIEGAHSGIGLGIRFLKHVERTKLLVHLLDASEIDENQPLANYETINRELALYSAQLAHKPQVVVLNKMDLPGTSNILKIFKKSLPNKPVMAISAATGTGTADLVNTLVTQLDHLHE